MARPDLVPPMANTLEVIAELTPEELTRCWVWVATPRHVEKAAAAGARNFQYCFSASDSHNRANIGRSTEDSLAAMPKARRDSRRPSVAAIQLCIATSFTCPFEGTVTRAAGARHSERRPHRGRRRRRRVRHPRPGGARPGRRAGRARSAPDTPQRRHRVPRPRHLGPRRREHTGRDRRRAPRWSTALSAGSAAAPSHPARAATPPPRTCCSPPAPSGSRPARSPTWIRLSGSMLAELGEPNRSSAAQGARSKADAFDWVIPAAAAQ